MTSRIGVEQKIPSSVVVVVVVVYEGCDDSCVRHGHRPKDWLFAQSHFAANTHRAFEKKYCRKTQYQLLHHSRRTMTEMKSTNVDAAEAVAAFEESRRRGQLRRTTATRDKNK